jgi:hypothetical protein
LQETVFLQLFGKALRQPVRRLRDRRFIVSGTRRDGSREGIQQSKRRIIVLR